MAILKNVVVVEIQFVPNTKAFAATKINYSFHLLSSVHCCQVQETNSAEFLGRKHDYEPSPSSDTQENRTESSNPVHGLLLLFLPPQSQPHSGGVIRVATEMSWIRIPCIKAPTLEKSAT